MTYLYPLSMGLHVEGNTGIGFGPSIAVWDSFTGESQLHFGQTRTAQEVQRVSNRLIDVNHSGGVTGILQRQHNMGQSGSQASVWLTESTKAPRQCSSICFQKRDKLAQKSKFVAFSSDNLLIIIIIIMTFLLYLINCVLHFNLTPPQFVARFSYCLCCCIAWAVQWF